MEQHLTPAPQLPLKASPLFLNLALTADNNRYYI